MAEERNIITDKLVTELTGKPMAEWFGLLDEKGAQQLKHDGIFGLVSKIKGLQTLGAWNQNLLVTTYEWSRGLKQRGEKEDGFEISVSKTIAVAVPVLYRSWADEVLRERWLPGRKIHIRKATENKSLRITWSDERTSVSVELYEKGAEKAQMVVQHMKIADAAQASEWKQFWSERLAVLKDLLA